MRPKYAVFARFADLAAARAALQELDGTIAPEHVIVRTCDGERSADAIAHGLMTSGASAESDGYRGIRIGLILGALLGAATGSTLFYLFEMPTAIGVLLGTMMGALIGALMSGIIGAGLINHNLKRLLARLEVGQALVTVLVHDRAAQQRVHDRLRGRCDDTAVNR